MVCAALLLFAFVAGAQAQELNARVKINHNQIQGTDNSVFEELEQTLTQFINEHQWTSLQFQKNERIACNFNITVTAYDNSTNVFTCKAVIQANRPVYNSTYTTTIYNNTDNDFNFEYAQFDQLQFNEEQVDNQLTALIAYYAYLIIGMNLDTFSPMGGEDILQLLSYGSRRDGDLRGARTRQRDHCARNRSEEVSRRPSAQYAATDMDRL